MSRPLPPAPEPLPAPVTDSHTHLESTRAFSGLEVADAIAAAAAVGVTRMVEVGVDVSSSLEAVRIAATNPAVIASVAIHPNEAARLGDRLPAELDRLALLVGAPKVHAVGETGLDYFRTKDASGQALQKTSFAAHIAWAKAHDLALVIHDRDAHADIVEVLDAEGWPARVVMHCFSGDAGFARVCLDRGAWLSFPGTVTFKPNADLREAALLTPTDRLLVETDAPYLTPVPWRGKPNSPYLLPLTVRFLAELRGADLESFCHEVTDAATLAFAWE